MKKLKLSELNLGGAEVLSREELKKVLGGWGSGTSGSGDLCPNDCYQDSDWALWIPGIPPDQLKQYKCQKSQCHDVWEHTCVEA